MGQFKEFIIENEDNTQRIFDILDEMPDEEIDEFGYYLYSEFFDSDNDEESSFDISDIKCMIDELNSGFLEDILDMLSIDNIEDQADTLDAEEFHDVDPDEQDAEDTNEAVGRRLLKKNVNRKKRKFMKNSKADMRRTKSKRKKDARLNKASRKKYYRANKQKISAYSKSRNKLISTGKHVVKKRRSA